MIIPCQKLQKTEVRFFSRFFDVIIEDGHKTQNLSSMADTAAASGATDNVNTAATSPLPLPATNDDLKEISKESTTSKVVEKSIPLSSISTASTNDETASTGYPGTGNDGNGDGGPGYALAVAGLVNQENDDEDAHDAIARASNSTAASNGLGDGSSSEEDVNSHEGEYFESISPTTTSPPEIGGSTPSSAKAAAVAVDAVSDLAVSTEKSSAHSIVVSTVKSPFNKKRRG